MNYQKVKAMATHLDKVAKYSGPTYGPQIKKVANSLRTAMNEYQKFFMKKLEEHGFSGISEMNEDEKKKFFNDIDSGWNAEQESD